MATAFDNLVSELSRLPGMGRRSAERAAIALARKGSLAVNPLVEALVAVRDEVTTCRMCGAITTRSMDPCAICSNPLRDTSLLLVVENPGDVIAFERAGTYNGLYHTLGGRISPQQGTGANDIALSQLESRIRSSAFREVILALPTDLEGDATCAFIYERLAAVDRKITRLAHGLPADSAVRYSDPLTLKRALAGRQSAEI